MHYVLCLAHSLSICLNVVTSICEVIRDVIFVYDLPSRGLVTVAAPSLLTNFRCATCTPNVSI